MPKTASKPKGKTIGENLITMIRSSGMTQKDFSERTGIPQSTISDWKGKKLTVFATSGGSGIGKTAEKLSPYVPGAEIVKAVLVKTAADVLK